MAICETIDWYAKHGEGALRTQQVAAGTMAHKKAWVRYEAVGVVGVISPWNYPFTLSMTPVLTALFAGCTVVLKPSEVTPTVGLAIGELFAGGPWGDIVQVVTGGGATGEALVRSGVDKVCFTGSVRTGKRVMAAAADTLTPVLLELGGKDPMVVCADADLERAAKGAVWGAFQNSGQTCMSVERVYVERSVYDEFVDKVVAATSAIRQDDAGGDIGSMTFEPQLDTVERHLAELVDEHHGVRQQRVAQQVAEQGRLARAKEARNQREWNALAHRRSSRAGSSGSSATPPRRRATSANTAVRSLQRMAWPLGPCRMYAVSSHSSTLNV
jgi:succinate-semialdehyde dehydrogenase/glutarate-semialdehyde dehydrogenase